MDPDSPRARINQFFVSKKKRKTLSPASASKTAEKDAKDRIAGSPSAKGSLDSFLVKSQEGVSPAKSLNPGFNFEANKGKVKRNLTLETGISSKNENKDFSPAKSLNPGYNYEVNIVKIKRNLTLEAGISSGNDSNNVSPANSLNPGYNCEANKVNVKRNLEINTSSRYDNEVACFLNQGRSHCHQVSGVAEEIQPALSSDAGIVAAGVQKVSSEFHDMQDPKPSDFVNGLSLRCSGIPSSVSLMSDSKSVALKRHVSPRILLQEERSPKRRYCGTGANQPNIQNELTSSSKAIQSSILNGSTHLDFKCLQKVSITGNTLTSQASLRKCDYLSLTHTSACETPGTLTNRIGFGETPRSTNKCFSISPGESFWREAILVADGLIAPCDRPTHHGAENIESLKLDYGSGTCNSNSRREGECNNLLDKTPLAVRGTACDVESASDLGVQSNHRNDLNKEASPLPVKQLDFCLEGKSCYQDISDAKLGILPSKQDAPSHHFRLQNNDLMHESYINKDSSRLPVPQRKPFKVVFTNKNRDSLSLDPGNTVSDELDKGSVGAAGFDPKNNCTPSSSYLVKDSLGLDNWLPLEICNVYKKKGILKLYPWQVDCLKVEGVLHNRNLVYCASTSAGKSFVAEILMLRRVISTGKIALLVLPYVSICTEKAEHLEVLLEPVHKHVRSYYGNQGGGALPKDTSIAVCTIEKANSLINRLLEEGRLSELGTIVIDELHMVGDQSRGYLLELLLTKLRYAAGEGNVGSSSGESSGTSSGKSDPARGLQIVGMSATLPNVASVADWLQAALYETDFRPVPLVEYIKVGSMIYNKNMEIIRTIPKQADLGGKDPDHVVELCNEVVQEGHSVLIFCSSRKGCETTAKHIAKFLKRFSVSPRSDQSGIFDVSSAIDSLQRSPAGLDPILEETIPFGVAYHHAGLTVEERETVETCYRKGLVRVLTATSTLAAGVNLPARRVIFRQPRIGRDFLDGTRYKQMAGRAGRTGIDTKGESVLICKPDEVKRILSLLNDTCPPLHSCLSEDRNGMTHAILEVVAGGMVQTASDINRYVRCTLLNSTRPFEAVVKSAQDSLRWLCHNKFLEWSEETKLYTSTPLGRASFGSSLCPEESLIVLDDLRRAREGFVLASDLHLVYLVTPINVDVEPDWELYYERFMQLSSLDQSVGNRVGVQEPFLMRMAHGAPLRPSHRSRVNPKGFQGNNDQKAGVSSHGMLSEEQILRVCKRFYVALILAKLVQEIPVPEVCEGFKVARGMVQALQENAGRFASMVSVFCERLGWHDLESLVAKFQSRVSFGVRAEIVELTAIPYVKGSRARALYKSGLRTPQAIAEASIPEIFKALFESSSWTVNGSGQRKLQVGVVKKIKNGARKIVFEKAEEARVAAFSAFKSLGLDIPQFTCPVLPIAGNSVPKESSLSSGEESTSSFAGLARIKHPLDASSSEDRVEIARFVSDIQGVKSADATDVLGSSSNPKGAGKPPDNIIGNKSDQLDEGIHTPNYKFNVTVNHISEADRPSLPPLINVTGVENHSKSPVVEQQICTGITEKGPRYAASFPGGLDSFLDQWDATPDFFFDIHFNKKSELNSSAPFEINGMAICWENSPVYYLDIPKDLLRRTSQGNNHATQGKDVMSPNIQVELAKKRWTRIGNVLGKKDVRKFTWNLKVQIQVLKLPAVSVHKLSSRHSGIKSLGLELIDNTYFMFSPICIKNAIDVSTIAWILSPDDEKSTCPNLEKEAKKRLSSDAAAAANRSGRWKDQMRIAAYNGCCRRVAQTRALYYVTWKLLESEKLVEPLVTVEMQLVNVLADMEIWGVGVDMEACLKARHIIGKKLKSLEKEAHKCAGKTFSLTMPADIANVLYEHLKLPMPEGGRGKQHPSTDKHCLDMLRNEHPIVPVIKEHRTLAKLLNSTLGSICALARLSIRTQRYTLHGRWLQTSTATGRLSMEEPNLQCVEHMVEFEMKDDDGKSGLGCYKINARDFVIPTQDEWFLLTADYSQIELRLMAHFSKDSSLIKLLSCHEADVFTMIAAKWTQKHESSVSTQERDQTKRLVYGILYGMGANTLADQLDCSSNEAAERIQSFKKSFPGVASWLQEAVANCRNKGYVETLKGRKRFLSKIKIGDCKEKSKAQRQAVNSICQGSAADIIKIAMLFIYDVIGEDAGASCPCFLDAGKFQTLKGRCRILLQVHDELVLEADPSVVKEAGLMLQKCMENAMSLLVPLPVKLKIGRTWGTLEPFEPNS